MATSGSKTISSFPSIGCTTVLSWTFSSSNIANNTQTVSATCKISIAAGAGSISSGTVYFDWGTPPTVSPVTSSKSTGAISANSSKSVSTTATITGSDSSGAAAGFATTVQVRFVGVFRGQSINVSIAPDYLAVNPNALDRKSNPTIPTSITLGTNFSVTTNRAKSTFTHTIQLKVGSSAFTNLATDVGASKSDCNASIATWAPYITTAASVSGTIRTITYENGTQLGYVDNAIVVNVPSSCVPSISTPTISDTNEYYDTYGYFLSGGSILHLTWQETISYGSAIVSRAVNIFGVDVAISGVSNSGCDANITNIGTNDGVATVTLTDGRGRTASAQTQHFKIFAYNKPVVGNSVVYRSDQNGDAVLSGDHISIRVPWTKSILLDENDNEINFVKILAKIDDTLVATYGSDTADAPNNQVIVLPGTYSDAINYAVELTVIDTVGQSSKYNTTIATVSRPMSVRAFMDAQTGTKKWGMAIGKISEIPEVLEIDVPQYSYKNITIQTPTNSYFDHKSTSVKTSLGTTVPSELLSLGGERVWDADGRCCYYSELCKASSDTVYRSFVVRRYSNDGSSAYYNGFYLHVSSNGSPSVTFVNDTCKNAWLSALGINISNYVKGMSNVVIRDTTHKYTIAAHGHVDFTVDLTTLGATLANQMVGFSVLCDNNANLIVTMCSSSGNGVTFRVHNPTAASQTMGGVVGILKYLSK